VKFLIQIKECVSKKQKSATLTGIPTKQHVLKYQYKRFDSYFLGGQITFLAYEKAFDDWSDPRL